MLFSKLCVNLQYCIFDISITDNRNESKINPSSSMPPALIKATYNAYLIISHFTDSLTSLSKEIQYTATCPPPFPLVTLLSYTLNTILKCTRLRNNCHAFLGMLPIFSYSDFFF